jgi:hypothetical protein
MMETRSSIPSEQPAPVDAAREIRRLQGCINDLISLQALLAIWRDQDATRILSILLEALLGMLQLDFAYARAIDTPDGKLEVVPCRKAWVWNCQSAAESSRRTAESRGRSRTAISERCL